MRLLCWLILVPCVWAAPALKVTPTTLSFTFAQGVGLSTSSQTISVAAVATGQTVPFAISPPSAPWITVTPQTGTSTLVVRVTVNVTSLPLGTYTERLQIIPTAGTNRVPLVVPVTLLVQEPPSDLVVTPPTVEIVTRLGETTGNVQQPFFMTTTRSILPFLVTTKGDWLSLFPATGSIFPGSRTPIYMIANPRGLGPGTYRGSATISTPTAITKTTTVNVNLVVQPGVPDILSVWPASLPAQSPTSTLTITGERFFAATTARINGAAANIKVIGDNALQMTVPASLMTTSRVLPIAVTNPGTGGGTATSNFVVTLAGPTIRSIANAATQAPTAAPGSVLVLYGQDLGPDTVAIPDPETTSRLPTELGGVSVSLQGEPARILYVARDQICITLPYDIEVNRPYMIQVNNQGQRSNTFPVFVTPVAPGLFTASGVGTGVVAAYAYDEVKQEYILVSEATPAVKGGFVVIYATGEGIPAFPLEEDNLDGFIANRTSTKISPVVVSVGGVNADVEYAGVSYGLVVGIMEITFRIPAAVRPGPAVPISLRIRNQLSPTGTILPIK